MATKVGVSVTTVSRVLNNRGAISQETRDKVFQAVKELNYFPNEMARLLSNKNSHLLGLIVPYIAHPFFSKLTDSIEQASYRAGYKLMLCTSGQDPQREMESFSMLCANNVAGVMICSRIEEAASYFKNDFPIVSIERTIPDIPSVSCDNYKGGALVAREMAESGCRRVLLFGNQVSEYLPSYLRYQGFLEECGRLGLDAGTYFIGAEDLFAEGLSDDIAAVFQGGPQPDGIFATSDVLAARLINCLGSVREKLRRLVVVGFDGIDLSDYCGISTVVQPIREMGSLAVDILLQRIEGKMVPDRSVLPVAFLRRNSSGPGASVIR